MCTPSSTTPAAVETPHKLGTAPYVLLEVAPSTADPSRLSLRVRSGGGIDTPAKVIAAVLALVEQVTGASCDEYAEQAGRALRERDREATSE